MAKRFAVGFLWTYATEPDGALMTDALMTAQDVAQFLRVGRATVYRYARQGALPTVRFGGAVRFRRGAVEAFAREDRPATPPRPRTIPDAAEGITVAASARRAAR